MEKHTIATVYTQNALREACRSLVLVLIHGVPRLAPGMRKPRPLLAQILLPIHLTKHKIHRANDGYCIGEKMTTADLIETA